MNTLKSIGFTVLIVILVGPSVLAQSKGAEPAASDMASLDRLFILQEKIRDLHPAFESLHPVAIVRDGQFHIYEPDPAARSYRLALTAPDKFKIPIGIRAAMPLDFWGNRMACVVTPEVFETLVGYAFVFHEFVHRYQWDTCELRLKNSLEVYKKAMESKDYMWELQYAFPYVKEDFVHGYETMLKALDAGDMELAFSIRKELRKRLSPQEWGYMTWQEWKEGSARFLENEVRDRFGLPANKGGLERPFTRVTFYAGGEALIRALNSLDRGLARNIEALYHRIAQ